MKYLFPVSYTHLDVYKRQALTIGIAAPSVNTVTTVIIKCFIVSPKVFIHFSLF